LHLGQRKIGTVLKSESENVLSANVNFSLVPSDIL
jgi:hypothetical protein